MRSIYIYDISSLRVKLDIVTGKADFAHAMKACEGVQV